jgi:vacuolar protein-sorting-associated protein 4
MTWRDVPRSRLKEPPVQKEDVLAVVDKVKPSVSQTEIDKCAEWTEKFGSEGA